MLEQGYGMIPNTVLYNNELSDKQKLLFCAISNLCAEKGYCRATNEYIGELLNADKRTISRNLSTLQEKGFISIEDDIQRKITLDKNVVGGRQKCLGGIDKNVYHNNTIEYNKEIKENIKRKGYGEFKKCLLSDDEYQKVINDYGTRNGNLLINQVDNYCASKGKSYKNYVAAIRKFSERAGIQKVKSIEQNETGIYDLPF